MQRGLRIVGPEAPSDITASVSLGTVVSARGRGFGLLLGFGPGFLRPGFCGLATHLAVALEEHALVDDQPRRLNVTLDVRAGLEFDLVRGVDITDNLAADDGVAEEVSALITLKEDVFVY